MKTYLNSFFLLMILFCGLSCTTNNNAQPDMDVKPIMEVTTLKINSDADAIAFAKRDAEVEKDFTSKQPGFIKRQSGVDDNGNYVVVVYWEKIANADASMSKFMTDASVADYAKMIDASSMKMSRYSMDKSFNAKKSGFVEIMSFDVKPNTDLSEFNKVNQRVETDFTGKRNGFLQRLTGVDESGRQVVAVYWENKELSDASLQPFMGAPIAKEFMEKVDQSSMAMGRYGFLRAI